MLMFLKKQDLCLLYENWLSLLIVKIPSKWRRKGEMKLESFLEKKTHVSERIIS